VARAVRGQPAKPTKPRGQVGPPPGAGERNYFASVLDELRKVVWPTPSELARMTGVVVTTVVLMAVIISVADLALNVVVKQLYSASATASQATPAPSIVKPGATGTPRPSASPSASSSTSPIVTPTPSP
jgi:preprotein translocase SecE subunit